MDKPEAKITITTFPFTGVSPAIRVAEVLVQVEGVAYPQEETFGSSCELASYLLGLRDMAIMLGRSDIEVPEVPKDMRFPQNMRR